MRTIVLRKIWYIDKLKKIVNHKNVFIIISRTLYKNEFSLRLYEKY